MASASTVTADSLKAGDKLVDTGSESGYVIVRMIDVSSRHVRVTTDAWVRTYDRGSAVTRLDD